MANLEERITTVEAHAEQQTRAIQELRTEVAAFRAELRTEVAGLRAELHTEVAKLRSEIAAVRSEMATRTDIAAVRAEMAELRGDMNRRFNMMDQKFVWLVGTQVATLLAVVGVLAGALYR